MGLKQKLSYYKALFNHLEINEKTTAAKTSQIGSAPGTPKFQTITRNNHIKNIFFF